MSACMHTWTFERPPPEVRQALERLAATDDVQAVAVMPDVHLGSDVCVGTVVATRELLFPAAIGGDIGCGMAAVALDVDAELLADRYNAAQVLGGFERDIPVLKHASKQELPEALGSAALSSAALEKAKLRDGCAQLGTLGRGNHFLEIQADAEGALWLTVHSGSRGMGQAVRDAHLRACQPTNSGILALRASSEAGQAYLLDMQWALDYAHENRRALLHAAARVVGAALGATPQWDTLISCHHNFVQRREQLWIHRKGAISAEEGEPGIIPGSMGDDTFHVSGRGHPDALWSSSHGAGRVMSRSEARRRISPQQLASQLQGVWYDHRKSQKLVDEAPGAYKEISKVMRAQQELVAIVRRLRPVLCFKGV